MEERVIPEDNWAQTHGLSEEWRSWKRFKLEKVVV